MNQERMLEPPTFISTKDLLYLGDALSWELLTMKKLRRFANDVQDQEISQTIDNLGQMHKKHYQILLKHLDPNLAYQGGR